jgi:ketosteroid isomerase-like protein
MDAVIPQRHVAVVREFYELVGNGRNDEAYRLLDDDLVAHEPPGLPYAGDYHGPAGWGDMMARVYDLFEVSLSSVEFVSAEDAVIIPMTCRFTSRTSRRSVDTKVIEVFSVRDGKIVDIDIFYKDPSAIAALAES